ncbi:hypothetical protein EDC04DRAFT_2673628 [Pisolithus marmoratus]|nr:hypothetical protein EDC04DRAFT_2673628 [Pisolithus marmoratus]
MMQLSHGIYKFLNRQSGTAMDVVGDSVKYLSVKTLFRTSPVVTTSYPTAWHINRVYLPDENAVFYEIRWPHSGYMFDLAGGESTPNTRIQIMDQSLESSARVPPMPGSGKLSSTARLARHRINIKAATTSRTNINTHAFNTTHNAVGTNGGCQGTVVGNERRDANSHNSTGVAPPPLSSSRSTVDGCVTRASAESSMGDSQETSFSTPTGMYSSGPGTQDVGGQMRNWKEDGRHVTTMEGKGGGGRKGFFAWLTGGKTDKAGKSKDL